MLSIPAAVMLVLLARRHGTIWHMYACGLYGASLVAMYTCSTLYHYSGIGYIYMLNTETLRNLDHCAVFFLIAGTYTPMTLINLVYNHTYNPIHLKAGKAEMDNAWRRVYLGWMVLIVEWTMCIVGVSSKLIFGTDGINPAISYSFYMIMGWMAALVTGPFLKLLPKAGLRLLVAGGLSYTIGVFFLLSDAIPFNHPVWHLLVGAGSIFHYFSVIACTIPIAEHAMRKKMDHKKNSQLLDRFTRFSYASFGSQVPL